MKILKSTLKRIIKEEYDRLKEAGLPEEEPEGYGVFFGKNPTPHERRSFKTKAEAEAALAAIRQQAPYTSKSFDPGGRFGMEVRPYGGMKPSTPAAPAPIEASPEQVQSLLKKFQKMLAYHDWHYERADDSRAYNAGREAHGRLMDTLDTLKRMGAGEEAQSMYDAASQRAYGRSM